jgi:hypothetical protein
VTGKSQARPVFPAQRFSDKPGDILLNDRLHEKLPDADSLCLYFFVIDEKYPLKIMVCLFFILIQIKFRVELSGAIRTDAVGKFCRGVVTDIALYLHPRITSKSARKH